MDERKIIEEFGETEDLPITPRLAIQMSKGTIRHIIDAIVELETNSDDSYKRLEQDGVTIDGRIKIHIRRRKYDKCDLIEGMDFAEGMDKEKLEKATRFGEETSGFKEGQSLRGFFGRGLKEAILALGKGEIYTIKDNKLSKARIWGEENKAKRRLSQIAYTPTKEERESLGITEGNGTVVRIFVTNEKIKCPDYKTLKSQITDHYALRDINSSPYRKVILDFELPEKGIRHPDTHIVYEPPKAKNEVVNKSIPLHEYGDTIKIKIYESEEKLESPYRSLFAKGGLLIKTTGAILENQLFRYENEEAGCFFFGEVIWEELTKRLNQGESLLDLNRVGIEWKHEVCQVLQTEIENILEPFVEKKRRELSAISTTPTPEKTKRMFNQICSMLNRFAKEVLAELPPGMPLDEKIEDLTILPPYANIGIDKERYFSVYAPLRIIKPSSDNIGEIKSDNPHIQILDPHIRFEPYRKSPDFYYKPFRVIGRIEGQEATLTCNLNEHIATAVASATPPKGRHKGDEPSAPKGGFFREFKADLRPDPAQRVRYDKGIIWFFVKFPVVEKYLDETLNPKTPESKTMLAELVGEAFCRFVANEEIERGKRLVLPGRDIDAFRLAMDDLQRKFLHLIHRAIFTYKW